MSHEDSETDKTKAPVRTAADTANVRTEPTPDVSSTLPAQPTVAQTANPAPTSVLAGEGVDLITSASTQTVPPTRSTHGSIELGESGLPEPLAREILTRRFEQAGLRIQPDYAFQEGTLAVVLDGFDPDRRIGYQYISKADADVVSDHDADTTAALRRLAHTDEVFVLIVHDHDIQTGAQLLARADEFLAQRGLSPEP